MKLGLLREMKRRGEVIEKVKEGKDYIEKEYKREESGVDCLNIEKWEMRKEIISEI